MGTVTLIRGSSDPDLRQAVATRHGEHGFTDLAGLLSGQLSEPSTSLISLPVTAPMNPGPGLAPKPCGPQFLQKP